MPDNSELPDHELILLLKDGDVKAFDTIYHRYARELTVFATSKLYSIDDAKDALHDLFTKLWNDRKNLAIEGNLRSYLFSALRYRVIDKIRKNTSHKSYMLMLNALGANYNEFIHQLEAQETAQHIDALVLQLPARTRHIYQLSRNKHLSIAEIAQLLSLSEQTVKNQLSMALKHLRKSLICISLMGWLIS
jgi:RNA polymerase sigma-70 factor (family 1)